MNACLVVGTGDGGDVAVERGADRGGRGRDGAAARLADRQHGRLGGAERDRDLRERRHRAGRHAHIAVPRQMGGPAGRAGHCASRAAPSGSSTCASATAPRAACCTTFRWISSRANAWGWSGHPGAGKSTLVNLLLHFYAPEGGRILIDGQDIATRDAGKPALADRDGDAGHLAAAPLDRATTSATAGRWARRRRGGRRPRGRPRRWSSSTTLEDWDGRRGLRLRMSASAG